MTLSTASVAPLPTLGKQATIAIVAPSGATDPEALTRAVAQLEALGYRVLVEPQVNTSWRYFSGTDAARLDGLHNALRNPEVDVVMATRGGYGLSRLLDDIDWSLVGSARKWLCGFSDFTAINLAALAQANLITLHGPGATADFVWGSDDNDSTIAAHQFMHQSLEQALSAQVQTIEVPFSTGVTHINELLGDAKIGEPITGTLWGGNLSMVAHLAGSRYWPQQVVNGGVLFLEEIAEDPYAIERMLYQLKFAGAYEGCNAIVLGQFTNCKPKNASRYAYSLAEVLETLRSIVTCPIFIDFPYGHVARKATLQIGKACSLTRLADRYVWTQ